MFIKNWKKEVFTIPNLLSLLRLVLIPVYVRIYLNANTPQDYLLSGIILAGSCLTDLVDGRIARKHHMISNLGKLLDPLADKITQLAITLCLSLRYQVLKPVLMLFLIKELFQLAATIVNLFRGKALAGALLMGKVCTTVLFVSMILMVICPDLPYGMVEGIAILDGAFLAVAFADYIRAFFGRDARVQDLEI